MGDWGQGGGSIGSGLNLDAFERLRVSAPLTLFDAQLTYDLQPLLFEQVTNGAGATITRDTTNCMAICTFANTPTGGKAYLQSFEHFRYQPGKALRHGEPVLTPQGWRRIEEMKVGDAVFDGLGAITSVTGVYPQGEREIVRVMFDDGTHVDCDLFRSPVDRHRIGLLCGDRHSQTSKPP